MLDEKGYPPVAAAGFQAPGVVVSYARNPDMVAKFKAQGLQVKLFSLFEKDRHVTLGCGRGSSHDRRAQRSDDVSVGLVWIGQNRKHSADCLSSEKGS